MKLVLAAAALFAPAVANAAPVYLQCQLQGGQGGATYQWNLVLDEDQQIVSYAIPALNVARRVAAIFSPTDVQFNGMKVSRKDLSFIRDNGGPGNVGACTKQEVKGNAF